MARLCMQVRMQVGVSMHLFLVAWMPSCKLSFKDTLACHSPFSSALPSCRERIVLWIVLTLRLPLISSQGNSALNSALESAVLFIGS